MSSSLDSVCGVNSNLDLNIGQANIDPALVDSVVKDLTKLIAPTFIAAAGEAFEKLKEKPDLKGVYKRSLPNHLIALNGRISSEMLIIPFSLFPKSNPFDPSLLEERYAFDLHCLDINCIDKKSSYGVLVHALRNRLSSLEISQLPSSVHIRFNKGHLGHTGDFWHRDSDPDKGEPRTVTICYSNIRNWSTRVLNRDDNQAIISKKTGWITLSAEEIAAVERVAKPSMHGFFYDGQAGLHRASQLSDLEGSKVGVNDYRLFVRFD